MKSEDEMIQVIFDAARSFEPLSEQQLLAIKLIIKAIPDIANRKDEYGRTALMVAAFFDNREMVHELTVNGKTNPDIQDLSGRTALMLAVECDFQGMVHELIVNAKAKLELQNHDGNTALDIAIKSFNIPMAILLLDHGALFRDPPKLIESLKQRDQRDPAILILFHYLCKQLDTQLKMDKHPKPSDIDLYNTTKIYLDKLKKLTSIYQKRCFDRIDEATKVLIPPLLNIITEYDVLLPYPRSNFFKAAGIDIRLNEEDIEASNDLKGNKKSICRC